MAGCVIHLAGKEASGGLVHTTTYPPTTHLFPLRVYNEGHLRMRLNSPLSQSVLQLKGPDCKMTSYRLPQQTDRPKTLTPQFKKHHNTPEQVLLKSSIFNEYYKKRFHLKVIVFFSLFFSFSFLYIW